MLNIRNLSYRIGGRTLLNEASLTLERGERVGLIGPNGTGKSTLLKLIAEDLQSDAGDIQIASAMRVGIIRQEAPGGATTPLEAVLAADQQRVDLLEKAEDPETPPEDLAHIHEQLNIMGSASAPARAARILAGLGFDEDAQGRPLESFSGGWRMRISLAGLLFVQPELLLLDEPSNHLDLEATLWLQDYLTRYPNGFLLVSHDRELLDATVTKIVHLEQGKLVAYTGNYEGFEKARAEQARYLEAMAAKQEAARKHMQAFVDRFRAKATKARQAQSRLKAIQKLTPIELLPEMQSARFDLPDPGEVAPPLLRIEDASVGYEIDKPVLRKLNLRLDPEDRIALLGANGNGKSTLIKLLAQRLKTSSGDSWFSPKLRVGYFAQDQAQELDLDATPLILMERWRPRWPQQKARAHLGRFGLGQDKVNTKVKGLSGGEKARLLLAHVTLDEPHLLLLDEPTNHLDMASRRALIEALTDFPGAVVLVSHDSHLVEHVADQLWLVANGSCTNFDGDLDLYRQWILSRTQEKNGRNTRSSKPKSESLDTVNSQIKRGQLKKEIAQVEKEVARLNQEVILLEQRLADPQLHGSKSAVEKISRMAKELSHTKALLRKIEDHWLSLNAQWEGQS